MKVTMANKELILGCDNAAVGLMKEVMKFLTEKGIKYTFLGVQSEDEKRYYPLVAKDVAQAIIDSDYTKDGILICGTGIGMSITANKFPGIYAAVIHDPYSAERARLSNNANVACLGARIVAPELAKKLLSEWLGLEFDPNSRSQPKLDCIIEIEKDYYK